MCWTERASAARDPPNVIGWPSIVTPLVGIRHRATEAISTMGCPRLFRPARRLVVWGYSTSASLGRGVSTSAKYVSMSASREKWNREKAFNRSHL